MEVIVIAIMTPLIMLSIMLCYYSFVTCRCGLYACMMFLVVSQSIYMVILY